MAAKTFNKILARPLTKILVREMLPEIFKTLKTLGYDLKKISNWDKGNYGFAFATAKGRVLKITADVAEASATSKIVGKKFKHVYQIFKVFRLKSYPGVYFIEQEKLQPLSSTEKEVLTWAPFSRSNKIPEYVELALKYSKVNSLEEFCQSETDSNYDAVKGKLFAEVYPLLKGKPLALGYWLTLLMDYSAEKLQKVLPNTKQGVDIINQALLGLQEMDDHNILYTDTHTGNILKDKSGLITWIDLGHGSKVKGKGKIKEINAMKKLIAALNKKGYKQLVQQVKAN